MNRLSQQRLENSFQERARGRHRGDNFTLERPIRQRFRQKSGSDPRESGKAKGSARKLRFDNANQHISPWRPSRTIAFRGLADDAECPLFAPKRTRQPRRLGLWTRRLSSRYRSCQPAKPSPMIAVNHVLSSYSLTSAIFDDLFRRLVSAAPDGITLNQTVRPDRRADLYHYHRPHREIRPARALGGHCAP